MMRWWPPLLHLLLLALILPMGWQRLLDLQAGPAIAPVGEVTPTPVVAQDLATLLATGERPSRDALRSAYLRSALELHREQREGGRPAPPTAWERRTRTHGLAKGAAVHVGFEWVPPAVQKPVRRWWREHRPLG